MAGTAKNIIVKYNNVLWFLLAIFALFAAVAKPMVWPDKIQGNIEQLQAEDVRIKETMAGKADKAIVEKDQELLKQDLRHVKEKVDKLGTMVEFLYFQFGGKPLDKKPPEGG